MCDCVCCAVATAAERARGSLYVIARELNPRGGPSSSSARTRCLRHARGDASGDRPVKRMLIFCLHIKSWRKRLKAVCQCVRPRAVAPNSRPCIQEVLIKKNYNRFCQNLLPPPPESPLPGQKVLAKPVVIFFLRRQGVFSHLNVTNKVTCNQT